MPRSPDETYLLRSRAVADVALAAQKIFRAVTALVGPHGMTESQYNALRVLRGAERRGERLTQVQLAQRLIASRANTTWILDRLETRKLIERQTHTDRRKNTVTLTAAGQKLLARIDPDFARWLDKTLGGLSEAELVSLRSLLDRFRFD